MSGQVHYRNQEERIDRVLGFAKRATTILSIVAIVFFLTNKPIVSTTMAQGTIVPTVTYSNTSVENSTVYSSNSPAINTPKRSEGTLTQGMPNSTVEYLPTKVENTYNISPELMSIQSPNNVSPTVTSGLTMLESCTFRLDWCGPYHIWNGQIEVINSNSQSSFGKVVAINSLGIGADQAAAYSLQQGIARIHHQSPRDYDGYDVTVTGYSGCIVRITLCAENFSSQAFDIKWDDLFYQSFQFKIADADAKIKRIASDILRIRLNRDNLVFLPAETFTAILTPYKLAKEGLSAYNPATISVKVQHSSEQFDVWQHEYVWNPETGGDIALSIPLPKEEGVYDVTITAKCRKVGPLMPRVSGAVNKQLESVRLQTARVLTTRKVQLTVVAPQKDQSEQTGLMETHLTCEIDPTKSRWWEQVERISQFPLSFRGKQWEYPLGNGNTRISQCELGPITELAANRPGEEPCWEAYICPIERPGIPHILEIEYPSNSEQTTGISIVEPNINGTITPGNIDSGFHVTSDSITATSKPMWKTHRIVFWPKTRAPVVTIYNLRDNGVSRYGKIRVMSIVGKLPKAYKDTPQRLLAAYMDRPHFTDAFSANKASYTNSQMLLDNWDTFYNGASRLIEYLNFIGYNGAMISITSDGSSIWPCEELAPTPQYDTGIFAMAGDDPVRKDVLEVLLRMFDRQNMQFIPAMELSQPIPALEEKVRITDSRTHGLQWIGDDGKNIIHAYPSDNHGAMYYNILNPEVQEVVLGVVSHLVTRYKNHRSFSGLAMQLTDSCWMILPPPRWGMDDETIRRFSTDTGITVPGEGETRFKTRADFLTGPALSQWLHWRSEKLTEFYCRLRNCIQSDGVHRKLYLSGAKLFTGCHRPVLTPRIPQTSGVEYAMLQCGLGANYGIGDAHDIVLMYTQRILNGEDLKNSAAERQWTVMTDTQEFFGTKNGQRIQASLFYHPYREIRLKKFEKKCPFTPAFALFKSIPTPASWENRRRFIQSLAMWDTQEFFDGGWSLAFGEEDAITNTLAAFRCLARREYTSVENSSTNISTPATSGTMKLQPQSSSQAIVCRWVSFGNSTWAYAINTTPYRLVGKIKLIPTQSTPSITPANITLDNVLYRFSEINNKGKACIDSSPTIVLENNQSVWQSTFAPFETQVVRFTANVKLEKPLVTWNPNDIEELQKSLHDLVSRANALKTRKAMSILENPDFELPTSAGQNVPQWIIEKNALQSNDANNSASIDNRYALNGRHSLHLISIDGWPIRVSSKDIATEATGRFTVTLWVKKSPDVLLRCRLQTTSNNTIIERNMDIKSGSILPIEQKGDWYQYRFHVNNLPLDNMGNIRIAFELPQKGEVWIDNVAVSDMYFPDYEQIKLCESLQPLIDHFERGEYEYCWKFQKGYWSQFLMDCVELQNNIGATGITAPYNGAIGHSATNVTPSPQTASTTNVSAGRPIQLSGTDEKKNHFGLNFGLGGTKNTNVVPTPQVANPSASTTPKPAPESQQEKKTLWQRATSWLPW